MDVTQTGPPIFVLAGPPRSRLSSSSASGFFGKKGFFPGHIKARGGSTCGHAPYAEWLYVVDNGPLGTVV